MPTPLPNADKFGIRKIVYFMSISSIIVKFESPLQIPICFEIPATNKISISIDPVYLLISWDNVRVEIRVKVLFWFDEFSFMIVMCNTFDS